MLPYCGMPTVCTARRKRSKLPCRNPAVLGANVCRFHGGSAPQVKRKANQRLAQAMLPDLTASMQRILSGHPTAEDVRRATRALRLIASSQENQG